MTMEFGSMNALALLSNLGARRAQNTVVILNEAKNLSAHEFKPKRDSSLRSE
jgi:hypothetical protein